MKNKHKQSKNVDYVVDNYRIPIKDFKVSIKDIADEIILGPQSEILEKIEHFNKRWFARWDYTKDMQVLDQGIGCTKTFRFKPGSQNNLKNMIARRAFGFDKKGSMVQVFSRYSRWVFNSLRDEMTEIEHALKRLRYEGRTWRDNTDEVKEVYQNVKKILDPMIKEANSLHPDFNFDLFMSYNLDHFDEQSEMSNKDKEIDNFEEAKLCLIVSWKNHSIQPMREDNVKLDPIPMGDVYFIFEIGFMGWLNLLLKNPLGEISYSSGNMSSRYSRYTPVVKMGAMNINDTNDISYASKPVVKHPYISSNLTNFHTETASLLNQTLFLISDLSENPNEIEADQSYVNGSRNSYYHNKPAFTYVCMGNGDSAIKEAFVNLDFHSLIMNLQMWSYFYIPGTRPLTPLYKSIVGLSASWSEDFRKTIAQDPIRCQYSSFRLAQIKERKEWKKNNPNKEFPHEDWFICEWQRPLSQHGFPSFSKTSPITLMLEKYYKNSYDTLYDNMADNCDKIQCTLREKCGAYISIVEYAIARDNTVPEPKWSKILTKKTPTVEVENDQSITDNDIENAIETEMINWAMAQRRIQ